MSCNLCPRSCNVDRSIKSGFCGVGEKILVSRVMLHKWEEPCISGRLGSGAVFFCGCPLKCVFCQNGEISRGTDGTFAGQREFTAVELADVFLHLQNVGAHNVNLVSPTQYTDDIMFAVADARNRGLTLPVVWNTGGYEKAETIGELRGTVDVFLTDMKYFSPALSMELSRAKDYFPTALSALREMVRLCPAPVYGEDGTLKKGVIVRHLILPGQRADSVAILRAIAEAGLQKNVLLSLMSQYTPDFFVGCADENINKKMSRRVTTFEYNSVRDAALELGFDGFGQDKSSANAEYTPSWGF